MQQRRKDLKEHRRTRTAPYLIVFFLVACLVVVLAVGGKKVLRRHGGDITKVFKKEESASDLFRSTITSTAYSVPIYETNVFGGWCVVKREVPKSANYDKDLSYQWTIIFYPDDDNHGTAAIVPSPLMALSMPKLWKPAISMISKKTKSTFIMAKPSLS